MRFDYACIVSAAADTGDPIAVFRPEVKITIFGPNGSDEVDALVDTGADNTVLPESVARYLGIPLLRATGPAAQAFGGQELALSYAVVELELLHADGNLRWLAHAYFAAAGADENDPTAILGREGFLEYFTAKFIGDEFALELEPNEYLPRSPGRG